MEEKLKGLDFDFIAEDLVLADQVLENLELNESERAKAQDWLDKLSKGEHKTWFLMLPVESVMSYGPCSAQLTPREGGYGGIFLSNKAAKSFTDNVYTALLFNPDKSRLALLALTGFRVTDSYKERVK